MSELAGDSVVATTAAPYHVTNTVKQRVAPDVNAIVALKDVYKRQVFMVPWQLFKVMIPCSPKELSLNLLQKKSKATVSN